MRKRSLPATCLLTIFCISCSAFAQRLDIALEGPWILYEDQHFKDKNNKEVPVLIAIAPIDATTASMSSGDVQHHHVPQMSTGEGYYLGDAGIYCIKFDDRCAPYGASSLTNDHGYPKGGLLQMTYHKPGDTSPWPWPQKSRGSVALILPMPDFYSNDGAWPMRFRATYKIDDPNPYDTVSSIGVILHYYEGPSTVSLFACDPTQPAASNCTTQVVDPDGNNVVVPNTGTLRLQMRAPDNDSVCDHHVRLGYHKMFTILSSSYNQQYSFIEPAKGFNSNGTGQFEDSSKHACFDEDQRLQDQGLFIQSQSASPVAGSSADAAGKESGAVHSMISVMLLNSALAQLKDIMNREHELQSQLQPAIDNINAASEGANKLEGFPKISSVRQVESHLNEAVIVIEGVRGKPENHLPVDVIAKLLNVETVLRILADRTKNGADCRAPLVLVQ